MKQKSNDLSNFLNTMDIVVVERIDVSAEVSRIAERKYFRKIAKSAYNVCNSFEKGLGMDYTKWKDLDDQQKEGIIDTVELLKSKGRTSASTFHNIWLESMSEEGWSYGKEYDEENKRHPYMVIYRDLPKEQRLRDKLFAAVVDSF